MIYARPGRRFLGFIVDYTVLALLLTLFLPLSGVSVEQLGQSEAPRSIELLLLMIGAAYQIGFIAWRGQTPGKMLLRVRVVDEATATVPTLTNATIRWLIPGAFGLSTSLAIFAWPVIYGWLLFDPRRQGLHDKLARTVVIDVLLPLASPDNTDPRVELRDDPLDE